MAAALLRQCCTICSARTLALNGALAPEGVADYLSDLLRGAEVAAARGRVQRLGVGEAMTLVGDSPLCERCRRARALAGFQKAPRPADAAARGMWRIARHARSLAA